MAKKWRCTVCGYIHEGPEAPDQCPMCKVGKEKFVEVVEQEGNYIAHKEGMRLEVKKVLALQYSIDIPEEKKARRKRTVNMLTTWRNFWMVSLLNQSLWIRRQHHL